MGNGRRSRDRGFDWDTQAADLLDVLRDGVIIADAAENAIVGWNPAAEQIFGYSADEAIGMPVSNLVPERLRSRHEAGLSRYAKTGTGHFVDNHDPLELPGLTKSGEEIAVEFQLTPIRESRDGRLYAAAIVRDVTDRLRQAEEQRKLRDAAAASQRLEAVGQLAAGVAHDFNNLLMVITGLIDVVLDTEGLNEDQRDSLRSAMGAAERGASLSRQLLAFARKSVVSPSAVSLNDALTAAARFLEVTLGSEIRLEMQLRDNLPRTMMDPAQVDQVLTNLALNAKDAMPHGGVLTIGTDVRNLPADANYPEEQQIPPGAYVRVWIKDTGVGMDEATRARVFEPFFTTKPRERGTGMGLAMVYGVVTQAGGRVRCTSAPGRGTTFELLLPTATVTEDPFTEDDHSVVASTATEGRNILLVDDDPALLRVMTRILERGGYVVTATTSPHEALQIAKDQGPFALLVSDIVMPGMDGVTLAVELRTQGGVGAVLLMSGYPEGALPMGSDPQAEQFTFLPKPSSSEEILRQIGLLVGDDALPSEGAKSQPSGE